MDPYIWWFQLTAAIWSFCPKEAFSAVFIWLLRHLHRPSNVLNQHIPQLYKALLTCTDPCSTNREIVGRVCLMRSTWQNITTVSSYYLSMLRGLTQIFLQVPTLFLICKHGKISQKYNFQQSWGKENPETHIRFPFPLVFVFTKAQKWHPCLYKHVWISCILWSCGTQQENER